MDQKINLDEIINQMRIKYPEESLTEFEKARYLYIELGKLLSFNINYISGHDKKSEDIYWEPVDFDDIKKNEYVCRQISDMYAELLRRAGIDSEPKWKLNEWDVEESLIPEEMTFRHKFTVVKLKDGRHFIADLVYDLPFIQKGMEPMFFGKKVDPLLQDDKLQKIDSDEIKEADRKIGYSYPADLQKSEFVYYDDFIQKVKADMSNEEHLRDYVSVQFSEEEAQNIRSNSLIKYKFDIITKFFDVKKFGFREGRMVLEKIVKDFFTDEEKENITMHDLFTEHEEKHEFGYRVGDTSMIKCFVWKKGENDFEYYIYEKGKNLRKVAKDEFIGIMKKDNYHNQDSRKNKIPGIEDDSDVR